MLPLPVEGFSGGRIRLDPLAVSDAAEMAGVLAHPGLYSFIGGGPPDVDALRERYQRQVVGSSADGMEQWLNWVLREAEGTAVGYVQATVVAADNSADIAWVVGVPWQGRGLAREAASALVGWLRDRGIGRITAHIHPDHAASAAVARAAGMTPTGELHEGEERWELTTHREGGSR